MEEPTYAHMESTGKIMRRSVHTFLRYYEYFTTIPVLLILPYSASILLSQALSGFSWPPLMIIHACLESFFHPIKFPPSSHFASLLNNNLCQIILTSLFSLTFSLTSLVIAKVLIIQALIHQKPSFPPPFSSFISLYKPLLLTQLCNSVLTIVIDIITISLLFAAFKALESLGLSANNNVVLLLYKVVFYSFLANAGVICNLALVVAGLENCNGFLAIRKACLLSWDWNSITISLNLPINLSILAVEGLFQYRVVGGYPHQIRRSGSGPSVALEGLLIAYLYSLLVVLDTVASCLFFKSCEATSRTEYRGRCYFSSALSKKNIATALQSLEISEVIP